MVTKTAARTQSYGKALALLATLFFMWGFISVINNTLLPHLRSVFDLNYTQTTLIEIDLVYRLWGCCHAGGLPDRACRLQEGDHHRACGHGGRRGGHGAGGAIDILRRHPGVALRDRERHRAPPGRGQPLCCGDRHARDVGVATDAGAGV